MTHNTTGNKRITGCGRLKYRNINIYYTTRTYAEQAVVKCCEIVRSSYMSLYASSPAPHRLNIRPAIRQQPVLTVDGSNTEYVRLTSRSVDRTPTPTVCVEIQKKKGGMAPASSRPAVGGSCREVESL